MSAGTQHDVKIELEWIERSETELQVSVPRRRGLALVTIAALTLVLVRGPFLAISLYTSEAAARARGHMEP
jgi:hypothetical protein